MKKQSGTMIFVIINFKFSLHSPREQGGGWHGFESHLGKLFFLSLEKSCSGCS